MSLFLMAGTFLDDGGNAYSFWFAMAAVLAVVVGLVIALARWVRDQPAMGAPRAGIPLDEWRRRGMGVQPSEGTVEFQVGQRCPLCHVEHQPTSEAARCDACGTLFHLQCALELGGCSSLGCKGTPRRVDAVRG
jgi:hypothetical protein